MVGPWQFTRDELENRSPSRKDGIDKRKETYLRRTYCAFIQDAGMRLKVYAPHLCGEWKLFQSAFGLTFWRNCVTDDRPFMCLWFIRP
jgi:hypothetical protein